MDEKCQAWKPRILYSGGDLEQGPGQGRGRREGSDVTRQRGCYGGKNKQVREVFKRNWEIHQNLPRHPPKRASWMREDAPHHTEKQVLSDPPSLTHVTPRHTRPVKEDVDPKSEFSPNRNIHDRIKP